MTKEELLELYEAVKSSLAEIKGVKLAYAINKNMKKMRNEVEDIMKASEPSKAYQDFDKLRVNLCVEHAVKDSSGQPVMVGPVNKQVYKIKDTEAFDADSKALCDDHKEVLDERKAQMEEYKELLKEEVSIDFHKIKMEDVNDDSISVMQMEILLKFVKEEKELANA